jgi:hypothetical protein
MRIKRHIDKSFFDVTMKKEISDHIAQTFFEKKRSLRRQDKRHATRRVRIFTYLLIALFVLAALKAIVVFSRRQTVFVARRLTLATHDGPYRLGFNFLNRATSKIETLSIDIPEINLREYRKIRFSLRLIGDDNRKDGVVKVSLMNKRKETSSLYLRNVGPSWKRIEIPRDSFAAVKDWSSLSQLSFSLEEWNVRPKRGALLIDGVEFVK